MTPSDRNLEDPARQLQWLVCQLAARVSTAAKRLHVNVRLELPVGAYKSDRNHTLCVAYTGQVTVEAQFRASEDWEVLIEDCTQPPEPRPGQEPEDARYPRKILMALAEALPVALEEIRRRAAARDAETEAAVARARALLEDE